MEIDELKVWVSDLRLGMYVSRLDRPWLDSPFLFQGLLIDSPETIEQLRSVCEYVFIDVERSDYKPAPQQRSPAAFRVCEQEPPAKRPSSESGKKRKPRVNAIKYTDEVSTESEIARAREAIQKVRQALLDAFEKVRRNEPIDAPLLELAVKDVVASLLRNPDAMIWMSRLGRPTNYNYMHCANTAVWAGALSRQMGLPRSDIDAICLGSLYCDLGKARVPKTILNKPARLTEEEMSVAKKHVTLGLEILENLVDLDQTIRMIVAEHHEFYDGSGYPHGLAGDEIHLFAQIAGIADCFDALINDKVYAHGRPISKATSEIYSLRGKRFGPELVEVFIQAIGLYPAGTVVELSNGAIAAVVGESRIRRLRPKVIYLTDEHKNRLNHFPIIDLMKEMHDDHGNELYVVRDYESGGFDLDPVNFFEALQ